MLELPEELQGVEIPISLFPEKFSQSRDLRYLWNTLPYGWNKLMVHSLGRIDRRVRCGLYRVLPVAVEGHLRGGEQNEILPGKEFPEILGQTAVAWVFVQHPDWVKINTIAMGRTILDIDMEDPRPIRCDEIVVARIDKLWVDHNSASGKRGRIVCIRAEGKLLVGDKTVATVIVEGKGIVETTLPDA